MSEKKRLHFVDGFRAVALLIMVSTHGFKAWIEPSHWTSFQLKVLEIVTKAPSAIFFFLVGISYVFARNSRLEKGKSKAEVLRSFIKRGMQLLLFAYLYKAIDLIFGVKWIYINLWLVDVLNIISISLIAVAMFDWFRGKFLHNNIWWFIAALVAILITPAIFKIPMQYLPDPVRWYFQGVPPNAYFTLFPFVTYSFFGAFIGEKLSQRKFSQPFIGLYKEALFPVAILVLAFLLQFVGLNIVEKSTKTMFFMKGFILLLIGLWISYNLQEKIGFGPLVVIGSHTMIGYWFHAKWIYIFYGQHIRQLQWNEAGWLLIKTYIATIAVVLLYAKIKKDRIFL